MSNNIPSNSSPFIETKLDDLKTSMSDTPQNVNVIVNAADGRKYQVTFYNVTQDNFNQIVTIEKVAEFMKTALLNKVGEKYNSVDIYNGSLKLREEGGKEKTITPTHISDRSNQLKQLYSCVNSASSNQNHTDTYLYRFKTPDPSKKNTKHSLTEADYKYFETNKISREVVDKYAGLDPSTLLERIKKLEKISHNAELVFQHLVVQKQSSSDQSSKTAPPEITVSTLISAPAANKTNLDVINELFSINKDSNREKIIELADKLSNEEIDRLGEELLDFIKNEYSSSDYFSKSQAQAKKIFEIKFDIS